MSIVLKRKENTIKVRLSDILLKEFSTASTFVTITRVELTKKLENAKVFFSFIGSGSNEAMESKLNSLKYVFRKKLAANLPFKRTPQIDFKFDRSSDYLFQMNKKIKEIL